jgi:hypothetical protein
MKIKFMWNFSFTSHIAPSSCTQHVRLLNLFPVLFLDTHLIWALSTQKTVCLRSVSLIVSLLKSSVITHLK